MATYLGVKYPNKGGPTYDAFSCVIALFLFDHDFLQAAKVLKNVDIKQAFVFY